MDAPLETLSGHYVHRRVAQTIKATCIFIETNNGPLGKVIDIYCHWQVGQLSLDYKPPISNLFLSNME